MMSGPPPPTLPGSPLPSPPMGQDHEAVLSVVMPCFNEAGTILAAGLYFGAGLLV